MELIIYVKICFPRTFNLMLISNLVVKECLSQNFVVNICRINGVHQIGIVQIHLIWFFYVVLVPV